MDDRFTVGLVERAGVQRLEVSGRDGWVEPICPECGGPIRWVLDMWSFVKNDTGGFSASHARCAWSPAAFAREGGFAPGET